LLPAKRKLRSSRTKDEYPGATERLDVYPNTARPEGEVGGEANHSFKGEKSLVNVLH